MSTPVASTFDLRTIAGRFRLVALAEAVSWVGLLVGMYFKYLGTPRTEIGVKVFGMAHGLIFIAFLVTVVFAALAFRWTLGTCLLALLAGIVPLASVIFLIWVDRTSRLRGIGPAGRLVRAPGSRQRGDVTDLSA
jgi:integral membrane protein